MTAQDAQPALDEPPQVNTLPPRRRSRTVDAVIEVVTTVALAIILYVVIQTFVVQTYRVEMQSMEPTLMPDQHLLIDKLTPRFDDYSRGDIVVFHPPVDTGAETSNSSCANTTFDPNATPFIKRVIGVGGDHVQLKGGAVYVNGAKLDEPYIASDGNTQPLNGTTSWDVPDGCLFVLGDHRVASQDSREFGLVRTDAVIGRAWLRFWPLNTLGILQTPTYPDVPPAPPAP